MNNFQSPLKKVLISFFFYFGFLAYFTFINIHDIEPQEWSSL